MLISLTFMLLAHSMGDSPEAVNTVPNGAFASEMKGWRVHAGDPANARIIETPSGKAIQLDARDGARLGVSTAPFPVIPNQAYAFNAMTRRIEGGQGYTAHVEWLDDAGNSLGNEYAYIAAMVGNDWRPYRMEAISPDEARMARVIMEIPGDWACQVADVQLITRPSSGPALAIDMAPVPLQEDPAAPWSMRLRIENTGDAPLMDLAGQLTPPEGVNTAQELKLITPRMGHGGAMAWDITFMGRPANPEAVITCRFEGQTDAGHVVFDQSIPCFVTVPTETTMTTAQLPPPTLPEMDIQLGAYYFPVMLDWDRAGWGVRKVDYLTPRLGFYDEAMPAVADWHIYWAVEHGVSWFAFDWYFNQGLDYLNDALDKGFLGSRFSDKMRFCVDWCNEGHCGQFKPVVYDDPALTDFITTLCERYFHRANYLKVDERPVVIIHVPTAIANAHGGWEGCSAALDMMRGIARSYGHPGVYFVALQNNTPYPLDFNEGGFDAMTAYAYGFRDVPLDMESRSLPYEPLVPKHEECFAVAQREAHEQGLAYIPSAWVGWDDIARSNQSAVRTSGNTPAAFRRMLQPLPKYVEKDTRLALIESWNEWGEGGHLEPGGPDGFLRLAAIRDILTKKRGPYTIAIPTPAEVARFDTKVTWDLVNEDYYSRYARKLGFHNGLSLRFNGSGDVALTPAGGIRNTRYEDGALIIEAITEDPQLLGPPFMAMSEATADAIRVKMRATAGKEAKLYWRGDTGDKWVESRSIGVSLIADGEWHEYLFPLAGHPEWKSRIDQFRFDPSDAPGMVGIAVFETDRIE